MNTIVRKKLLLFSLAVFLLLSFCATLLMFKGKLTQASAASSYQSKQITTTTYQNADNKGYYTSTGADVTNKHPLGGPMVSFFVNATTVNKTEGNTFGVTGEWVELSMRLNYSTETNINGTGYNLSSDSATSVRDVKIGTIGKGALTLLVSKDGKNWDNWTDIDGRKWNQSTSAITGLTNIFGSRSIAQNYNKMIGEISTNTGDKYIYAPSGVYVKSGYYYTICFAYETYYTRYYQVWVGDWYTLGITGHYETRSENIYQNFCEIASFNISNESVESVTFKNLNQQADDMIKNTDAETQKWLNIGESISDNGMSNVGFKVDAGGNSVFAIKHRINSGAWENTYDGAEFRTTGKHEIQITSRTGRTITKTVYVDTSSKSELLSKYFGGNNPFDMSISRRIYDETSSVPVYQANYATLKLKAVDSNTLPLTGVLKNLDTNETVNITANRNGVSKNISKAGNYIVQFFSNEKFITGENASGDCVYITFKFKILATAPGPRVNEQTLKSFTSIVDFYPKYFAVTYNSAGKGDITVAFHAREDAEIFALNYESGIVEVQPDGSYRYKGTLNSHGQKVLYPKDGWNLASAIQEFARQAVQELYFDASDIFSIQTLPDIVIQQTKNLRTLELPESVIIFAEGERDKQKVNNQKPYLNNRQIKYVKPTNFTPTAKTQAEYNALSNGLTTLEYKFVKDSNGYDSHSVTLRSPNGVYYSIEYNRSVQDQLLAVNAPSGVYDVIEQTIYGESRTYQAQYTRSNDADMKVVIESYFAGNTIIETLDSSKNGSNFSTNLLVIKSASDTLDAYSIIKVIVYKERSTEIIYKELTKVSNLVFAEPARYEVSLINRFGTKFMVTYNLEYQDITFSFMEGNQAIADPIETWYGAKNIEFPKLKKYGYNLKGFKDEQGNLYTGLLGDVKFTKDTTFTPEWEAKEVIIYFKGENLHSEIESKKVHFGDTVTLPNPQVKIGFDFRGWKLGEFVVAQNLKIETEETINLVEYSEKTKAVIRFNSIGGTSVPTIVASLGEQITLPEPVRAQYTFLGWLTVDQQELLKGIITVLSIEDKELIAQYLLTEVYVSLFDVGNNEVMEMKIAAPSSIITLAAPKNSNNFDYWIDVSTGVRYYAGDSFVVPELEEVKLIAYYKEQIKLEWWAITLIIVGSIIALATVGMIVKKKVFN